MESPRSSDPVGLPAGDQNFRKGCDQIFRNPHRFSPHTGGQLPRRSPRPNPFLCCTPHRRRRPGPSRVLHSGRPLRKVAHPGRVSNSRKPRSNKPRMLLPQRGDRVVLADRAQVLWNTHICASNRVGKIAAPHQGLGFYSGIERMLLFTLGRIDRPRYRYFRVCLLLATWTRAH